MFRCLAWPATGILVLTAQIAALHPVWRWYLSRLQDGSDEPWGIVALISAILLGVRELIASDPQGIRHSLWPTFLLTLLYIISFNSLAPLLRALVAVAIIASSIFAFGNGQRCPAALTCLFILSLPVIASLQFYLGFPLRLCTAWVTAHILSLLDFAVTQQGTTLFWRGNTVIVDAPCSGVRMLWVGLVLSCFLAYKAKLSEWNTCLCLAVGVVLLVVGNVLRSTLLFFKEAAIVHVPGWTHTAVGMAIFLAIAVVMTRVVGGLSAR